MLKSLSEQTSLYVILLVLPGPDSEQARRRPHISLVLMDSRLDCLNMPVLKPHIQGPRVAELEGPNDLSYRVAFLMDHYFEWVGTFEFGAFAKPRNHPLA